MVLPSSSFHEVEEVTPPREVEELVLTATPPRKVKEVVLPAFPPQKVEAIIILLHPVRGKSLFTGSCTP